LSITLPALQVSPNERSASSLEKEIMRLQEVLREREAEIAHLEHSLKDKGGTITPATTNTPALSESPTADGSPYLTPYTVARFESLKAGIQNGLANGNGHGHSDSISSQEGEQLERLNELMRCALSFISYYFLRR
jgi:hypothetical protein